MGRRVRFPETLLLTTQVSPLPNTKNPDLAPPARKQLVAEYFGAVPERGRMEFARYNIAPTQPVPVIHQNPKKPVRELSLLRWGLIPSWAKDASGSARMINARSESAAIKPAFRDALKLRRCLVPAGCVLRVDARR